ncbi:hypothetical protein [Pantoea eucrina]|uniref:Uncharacterized protein n=1 Tax=Pantoea eucrina TaxID=472693 RepID=A0ABU5LDQ1_9GAMM|nr:hypothetical protein [Pantoea eucrina]MDZ7278079.1 hypothetical protein [Pantoea eucrina]
MQEGYYWVQHDDDQPEVWFWSNNTVTGWFKPTHHEPLDAQDFAAQGYKVVSDRLSLS